MNNISKLIKEGDVVDIKLYLLEKICEGKISVNGVKRILHKIENSSVGDSVFSPYVDFDGIKTDKNEWDRKYLWTLRRETVATGKFDKAFVLHMSEVADYVYRNEHLLKCIGVTLGIISITVLLAVILKWGEN